jgi:aldehyde:ferredoxin oxidoreductase
MHTDFYTGKVLRVDLTTGVVTVEPLNTEWARLYIGGKGLLFRYLLDEVEPGLDPWSPANPLIFMTGPFAGTTVSTCSRLVVGCKSPATGTILDSYVGGSFAPELKFAGYDALIVTGRAAEPTLLWIKDDVVELRPAAKYTGMRISEVEAALRADLDPLVKSMSNGPAGEHLLPWACLSTDQYHKAGRGGAGALMGVKNLKAIAVRGTGAVTVGDARAFLADMERIHREYVHSADNFWAHEEGTLALVDMVNVAGAMPTRNWSKGYFADTVNVDSSAFLKVKVQNRACSQCAIGCRQFHEVGGVRGEGPEFETVALCGPNCGIGDMAALMQFNAACDDLGMDTISTGNVVGLAMDLTERGIADYGLRFGEAEGYVRAPELIARREGIGADLALGSRDLAAKHGHPELAMQVKNLELPGYDPRGSYGMSVAYATADRGGCHQRSYVQADEILGGDLPPDTMEGKAQRNVYWQDFTSLKYTGIWCEFWAIDADQIGQLMKHVWRREVDEDELMAVGARIWNLSRLFNLREGFTRADDTVPVRLLEEPFDEGPSAGRRIGGAAFEASLDEYYALRGWDARGVPTQARLDELRVDVRLDDASGTAGDRLKR